LKSGRPKWGCHRVGLLRSTIYKAIYEKENNFLNKWLSTVFPGCPFGLNCCPGYCTMLALVLTICIESEISLTNVLPAIGFQNILILEKRDFKEL